MIGPIRPALALATLFALLAPLPVNAQAQDGNYTGKISCEIIAGQTRRQLATDIRITISGTNVSYEREILTPDGGGTTGIKERGTGSVNGGNLSMTASGRGNSWSYESSYNGTIASGAISMRGVQKWHVNNGNQDRQCTIAARRS